MNSAGRWSKLLILWIGFFLIANASLIGVMGTVSGAPSDELHRTGMPSASSSQASPIDTECDISGEYQSAIVDGRVGEVRVVRPESLDNLEHPRETAEAFAEFTRLLNISDSAQDTTVGIVPPDNIEPAGYAVGDDVCLRGTSQGSWDGLMAHEYVHTRQEFETSAEMDWFIEASAFYYMGILPYARGSWGRDPANNRLNPFPSYDRSLNTSSLVLLDSQEYSIWRSRGPPVLAALDREIRFRTDGNKTLEHVIQKMNQENREITYSSFQAIVSDVAGERMGAWLDTYITEYTPPHYEETRVAGLTLTSPAANPEFEVVDVTLSNDQNEYNVTSSENLTIAKDSPTNLEVTVQHKGAAQVRQRIRIHLTSSDNESILLGSQSAIIPANETQTVTFTNQTRLESLAEINPGTHVLTLEVGSTTYNQTTVVEAAQTPNGSSNQDSDETEVSTQYSDEPEIEPSGTEEPVYRLTYSNLPLDYVLIIFCVVILLFSFKKATS